MGKTIYGFCENKGKHEVCSKDEVVSRTERKGANTKCAVKGLANGNSITSPSVKIEKTGYYALNFFLKMCGANQITDAGAYFQIMLYVNGEIKGMHNLDESNIIAVPIAKVWNYTNTATVFVPLNEGDIVTATFINRTGISTDAQYDSNFGFNLIKVSE